MQTPSLHRPTRHPLLLPSLLLIALNSLWLITLILPLIHLDDPNFITFNPYVTNGLSWKTIHWAFTTSLNDSYWLPLTWISLALDATLFGNAIWGYHLTNTLFHIANTLLVFALFRTAGGSVRRSLFAAILFSLHPQRVESVAWATERKDVLAAFFGLLSLLAYFRYVRAPSAGRYLLICLLFFLAFLSKPLLVTFPALLLLLDFWPLQRLSIRTLWPCIREKIPLFLLALDAAVNVYIHVLTISSFYGSLTSHLENCVMNYAFYLRDLFFPAYLSLYYRAPLSFPLPQVFIATAILIGITAAAFLSLRARSKYAKPFLIGWLWFLIAMFPTSGFAQATYSTRGDRFTYIPCLGLILALLWGLAPAIKALRRPRPALALAGIVTLSLCLCTINRLLLWRDNLALYQHDLALDDQNAYLHEIVGIAAQERGQTPLAIEHFRRAAALDPEFIAPPAPSPQTAPAP